jgi:hypothetical protein
MAHRVEYNERGTRARIIVDLDGASLDADANPIGSEWQTLKNVLTNLPGVLQKRGAIVNAGANSTDIVSNSTGVLAFYDGPPRAAAALRPYLGTELATASSVAGTAQASSSGGYFSFGVLAYPVSKAPTVDEWLILSGRDAGNATYPNRPTRTTICAGSNQAPYTTGTVTVASGSAAVTGSGTTFTSAMEGATLEVTGDTYLYAYYRVRRVVSATVLYLDRPFAGSNPGAGRSYTIRGTISILFAVTANPFGAAGQDQCFKLACGAWGRLVVASTREAGPTGTVGNDTPEYPSRIRWSGAIGSDDGVSGASGFYAWDSNGYVDLSAKYGEILALVPSRDSVLAFQSSGLTVIHGDPVYDGTGSLDISETHPGVAINGGFAFESTPEGVFFFDKNVGACVYDGTRVVRLGDARVTRTMLPYGITAVGYYDGKVLFSGTTTPGIFVFDTATAQWSLQVPPAIVSCLIAGRVENDEDVVGLGGGTQVVNLANMFDAPGVAATDWDSSAFVVDIKTGKIGDAVAKLRPERAFITYRLTDLSTTNPYLSATITTGLPDTSDSQHTYTNGATELIETTDVETRELQINLDRDPMAQIRLLQSNAAGKLEIYSIVIDCAVEGEGFSS